MTTGYQYDPAGRVAAIVYPSGRVLNISRTGGLPNAMGLTPAGGGPPIGLLSNMQFNTDPTGNAVPRAWAWRLEAGGSLVYERHFDTYGRAIRYPVGGAVRDLSYDTADRIVSYRHWDATNGVEVVPLNQSFGYDELSRLTGVATAQGTWSIAYDDNGNRSSVAFTGASTTNIRGYSTPATSNRLTALSSPTRSFVHDPAGNTVSDTEGFRSVVFTIDLPGRISRTYATPDGLAYAGTGYVHDNFGRRVLKLNQGGDICSALPTQLRTCVPQITAAGIGVVYVYDQGGRLLGEYRLQDGAVLREYVWLDDMPVAIVDGAALTPTIYYLYTDHLGTPRVAIDTLGRQRWSWMAEPFGNSSPNESPLGLPPVQTNLRMPGQYFDSESGLAYNWHRTYDATVGRYTQSDPIGLAGGVNTYTYVGANPVNDADPTGEAGLLARALPSLPVGSTWTNAGAGSLIEIVTIRPEPVSLCRIAPLMCATVVITQAICKPDEKDKAQCDKDYEKDKDRCWDEWRDLKGGGFQSALSGCLGWARERWKACYRGDPDPGRWTGGDSWPGGRNR